MKRVLVTGAGGFLGKNLTTALRRRPDVELSTFGRADDRAALDSSLAAADFVYHLAGVNRPEREEEFLEGNRELTRQVAEALRARGRPPTVVFSSSYQAALDNPYGRSKRAAEELLEELARETGANVCIYRLPNVFGKWSRPEYNSVVATFCHNLARGLDITIDDRGRPIELAYVDDVVAAFVGHLDDRPDPSRRLYTVPRTFEITLGELADTLRRIRDLRAAHMVPDVGDPLTRRLAATYISFLPEGDFAQPVELRTDERGWLFELIKSEHFGQIFVSTTRPGITRGDHYHDTKVERFCLVQGEGLIRFRPLGSDRILEYPVSDSAIQVVDIPPGYTHSIENVGDREMIVLFWANEIFDPQRPDTHAAEVLP